MRWLTLLIALLTLAGCGGTDVLDATEPANVEVSASGAPVERVWRASVGEAAGLRHRLEPAVAGERIYAAGAAGRLAAFDAASGDAIWRKELSDRLLSGGPAVGDGLLVIGTREGRVLGFDAANGEARWDSGVTSEVLAPAAIGQDTVIVRSNDGRVFALNPADGERRWLYDRNVPSLTLRGHSAPVLVKGGALVGFDNGRLVALKLADGSVAWEATVATPSGSSDLARMVDIDGDPRVEGSQVFATSYQGRAVGLAVNDGSIAWTRDISSANGPGLGSDKVYVSDTDGRIWALDRSNGATVWRQEALSELQLTAPRRFGDHLVVGASDGSIYWLSPDDGELTGRLEVGGSRITVPPVVAGSWLYAQTVRGELVAFRRTE